MLDAMDNNFPDTAQWTRPEGGMFIWVTLPEHVDATALLQKAIENLVAFVPGEPFYAGNGVKRNTLRLSFATVPEEKIREGIAILGKLIKEA
ncbi:aminotransferase class I/II-fold pyridoxal phosphate-dependent enzyme, partial [Providencia rettgeri]|nr:aminotransferase class I/II-fold pyridoxal phosphate-dependent enzyme [Providencia rettgeri]